MPDAPSWKRILLPPEHGGWGFLFEPILLGLLVAPSWPGLALGLAAVAAFFTRQPLKLALADRRRGKRYPRTVRAERAAGACAAAAALFLALGLAAAGSEAALPLLLAAPLGLVQVVYDARLETRSVLPELAGSAALGATAPMLAMADGWSLPAALGLWGIVLARNVPSILYARTMVRRLHGEEAPDLPALAAHVLSALAVGFAAEQGLVPPALLLVPLLLLFRAAAGLSRGLLPARRLGWGEIAFGLATVLLAALAYRAG
ncbi:MAG TPA: YwiC-like family protein [Thermoanaerobaculia bacterium]|nr:YwiC-like family protein [Thermoanaerobaculia bacterium]